VCVVCEWGERMWCVRGGGVDVVCVSGHATCMHPCCCRAIFPFRVSCKLCFEEGGWSGHIINGF
jgi:hypothetical protein